MKAKNALRGRRVALDALLFFITSIEMKTDRNKTNWFDLPRDSFTVSRVIGQRIKPVKRFFKKLFAYCTLNIVYKFYIVVLSA